MRLSDPRGEPTGVRTMAMALVTSLLWVGCQASEAREDLGSAFLEDATGSDAQLANPDAPGVRQTGPNQYEAVVIAFEGGFDPTEIRVPLGAEVRFRIRSADVGHGLLIEGTDVALEAAEGFGFAEATHTFTEAGAYAFLCHIYCIGGHESMTGVVIVE